MKFKNAEKCIFSLGLGSHLVVCLALLEFFRVLLQVLAGFQCVFGLCNPVCSKACALVSVVNLPFQVGYTYLTA